MGFNIGADDLLKPFSIRNHQGVKEAIITKTNCELKKDPAILQFENLYVDSVKKQRS